MSRETFPRTAGIVQVERTVERVKYELYVCGVEICPYELPSYKAENIKFKG